MLQLRCFCQNAVDGLHRPYKGVMCVVILTENLNYFPIGRPRGLTVYKAKIHRKRNRLGLLDKDAPRRHLTFSFPIVTDMLQSLQASSVAKMCNSYYHTE